MPDAVVDSASGARRHAAGACSSSCGTCDRLSVRRACGTRHRAARGRPGRSAARSRVAVGVECTQGRKVLCLAAWACWPRAVSVIPRLGEIWPPSPGMTQRRGILWAEVSGGRGWKANGDATRASLGGYADRGAVSACSRIKAKRSRVYAMSTRRSEKNRRYRPSRQRCTMPTAPCHPDKTPLA